MSSPDASGFQNPSGLSSELPQPAVSSQVGGWSTQSSTIGKESRVGTETQPHHIDANASDQTNLSAFPPLFDEIRLLQERLLQLESEAAQQWKATVEDAPLEDSEGDEKAKTSDSYGDKALRKHIRKAPVGRRWVEKTERRAKDTAEERKEFGQDPNKSFPMKARSTMYHVQQSGDLFQRDELMAVAGGPKGWLFTHGRPFPGLLPSVESEIRQKTKPLPHRGVRPPTSVRPFYERPVRSGINVFEDHPPRLSRKLGPPTEWDESDSEEWSSDTSTRSQDFKYFRARLRGDFEWELDRLNAQVIRYRKHQDKRKARELAVQAEKAKQYEKEAVVAHEQHSSSLTHLGPDEARADNEKQAMRQLNPMGWSAFLLRLAAGVIDVLIEEPRLSSDIKPWARMRRDKTDKDKHKKAVNLRTPGAKNMSGKDDATHSLKEFSPWTAQDPLPERIRINSKQIIDILSSIHGSPLCLHGNEPSSVALLRPFRILHAYDKEIREMCSKLEDGAADRSEQHISVRKGVEKKETEPCICPDEETFEKPSDAKDETRAVELKESPSTKEEQRLQLEHLRCLRKFMDDFIGRKVAYLNNATCSKIFFSDVWHLFQPGTTVISADGKQAYRVISLNSKPHKGADRWEAFWTRQHKKKRRASDSSDASDDDTRAELTIKCVFIHFDGETFGPVLETFHINKWDGEKDVTYLEIYPFRFHILKSLDKRLLASKTPISMREQEVEQGAKVLRQKLIDRGKVFLDVAAVKQMYYAGLAVDTRDEIESQVMVDFEEALAQESKKHWIPKITRLVGTDWNSKKDETDEGCTAECCWKENVHDDAYVETNNTDKFIDDMMAEIKDTPHQLPSAIVFPRTLEEIKSGSNALTDDELMIMSYSVFGFVLRDRTWAKLDLDCMSAVRSTRDPADQTDDDLEEGGQGAFGKLVLPRGHKKMVLSLISQHFRNKGSQESNDKPMDIVRGKGKGLIILLHGAPGVGKTTTAEGVAETFGQPLFQITCGDLGSNPRDVEDALQTNFALANRWGCILLLDEADVFLAERRREDFNRNGLVAVFLRVLEYYAGILFLTTNRIGDFDEAFASRIHMSLHYPALDELSTAKVFQLNLDMIKTRLEDRVKIDELEIITAAQKHWRERKHARWNGRQIRNACQTALALAEFEAQPKGKKYDIKEKSTTKIHLRLDHLDIVSNAYLEFTDYLKAVHGADAEGRAKESGLRALDTLLDALKSDKTERRTRDRSSSSAERGNTGREPPFQGFRLRPSSSGQHAGPRMPSPSSQEQASQHSAGQQGFYSPHRPAHEHSSGPAQRMQYMGNQQYMGDHPSGAHPTTQHVQPGTFLQAPQSFPNAGRGGHGHYQSSDPYMHDNQQLRGHGVSYPSPPPSAVRGGPVSGSASLGHFGDEQSRQAHPSGQGPFDESEQM